MSHSAIQAKCGPTAQRGVCCKDSERYVYICNSLPFESFALVWCAKCMWKKFEGIPSKLSTGKFSLVQIKSPREKSCLSMSTPMNSDALNEWKEKWHRHRTRNVLILIVCYVPQKHSFHSLRNCYFNRKRTHIHCLVYLIRNNIKWSVI